VSPKVVLVFNAGSSSLKFGLYEVAATAVPLLTGEAENIGKANGRFQASDNVGREIVQENLDCLSIVEAVGRVLSLLQGRSLPTPDAIGHRFVHGGSKVHQHVVIDANVFHDLESSINLAPLHVPTALAIVRQCNVFFRGLPEIACLDTAFHSQMPEQAWRFPLPASLSTEGVVRYGFHGLSCESIIRRLSQDLPSKVIIAHLGNGASITAVANGRSVDTTMGLTPLGGMMMGTRSGDLDPGVLLYLLREKGFSPESLERLLECESGLAGISGGESDIRALERQVQQNQKARLALSMFCLSARKFIAAMVASLEGLDLLVFTGGIGEHSAGIRSAICSELKWMGAFETRVMPAQEEEEIALVAANLLHVH
jgi:acetate kinase